MSYLRLSEDGHSETGGGPGFDLTVDRRTGELLTAQGLLALGWRFGDELYWAPEFKLGYRARPAGGPARTTAHFDGGADFTLDLEDVFNGGAVARVGFRVGGARFLYAISAGEPLTATTRPKTPAQSCASSSEIRLSGAPVCDRPNSCLENPPVRRPVPDGDSRNPERP